MELSVDHRDDEDATSYFGTTNTIYLILDGTVQQKIIDET